MEETIKLLKEALGLMLKDAESLDYGYKVEDIEHPWHESVTKARRALAQTAEDEQHQQLAGW